MAQSVQPGRFGHDKARKIARTLDRLGYEVARVPLQRQGAGENRIT